MPGKTILLVEDEEDIRTLYAEVLRDAGYTVLEAKDGNIAMDKVFNEAWDMLLLDIMLPGHDGLQILKKLKEAANLKDKPVILLTNLGNDSIITQSFNLGADGYLIKSEITPDKIIQEVETYLK